MRWIKRHSRRCALALLVTLLASCTGPATDAEARPPAGQFTTNREWMEAVVACMRAKGWNAVIHPEHESLGFAVPDASGEVRMQIGPDSEACRDQVGPMPEPPPPLTDELILEYFDKYIEGAACLEAEGITISPPPSPEVFLEQYRSTSPWNPWMQIPDQQFAALERRCPQP